MTFQSEFPFTLPRGFVDAEGRVHKEGTMRLATAKDEVTPLQDYRVKTNPGYLAVILLARVVTRLGDLPQIYPQVIEDLPVADFAYLQTMYRRINEHGHNRLSVTCPACEKTFEVEAEPVGES
ncbi:phage tail assembly protein [Variovorax sp. J22R115]|uniref:phage tail assembly protein n=1 Tax=Variovorax sp. J22R115 TaxID=3053509 RepID=UPI0025781D4C|nr:phage tail assembly protein [Variovorax sp. J22R115]MDM0047911.1 phage tail assembly protein [Variovorax sp. J22R115]